MPIPLGILAQYRPSAAAGSYELIQTQLITTNTASVTFSSIPQDYKHLQVRATIRTSYTQASDNGFGMRINNVSTTGQYFHFLSGNSNQVQSSNGTNTWQKFNYGVAGASLTANYFSSFIIDILDYSSTTKRKTVRTLGGIATDGASSSDITLASSLSTSTVATTSLVFGGFGNSSSMVAGTRLSLYGIKG